MRIESITRRQLFHTHPFVRAEIQYIQYQEASWMIDSDPVYWRRVSRYYDLYDKGAPCPVLPASEFIVLAYPAQTRVEYTRHFIPQLLRGFKAMGARNWVVVQPLAIPWLEYRFANERKRAYFNRITNEDRAVGFIADTEAMHHLLQACLFAHPDGPTFLFFALDHPAAMSASLCKDGNVHLNIHHDAAPLLKASMEQVGFWVGDLPLCSIQYRGMLR